MTQHEISHKCVRMRGLVVTLINIRFDYEQLKHEYTFLGYLILYRDDIFLLWNRITGSASTSNMCFNNFSQTLGDTSRITVDALCFRVFTLTKQFGCTDRSTDGAPLQISRF